MTDILDQCSMHQTWWTSTWPSHSPKCWTWWVQYSTLYIGIWIDALVILCKLLVNSVELSSTAVPFCRILTDFFSWQSNTKYIIFDFNMYTLQVLRLGKEHFASTMIQARILQYCYYYYNYDTITNSITWTGNSWSKIMLIFEW